MNQLSVGEAGYREAPVKAGPKVQAPPPAIIWTSPTDPCHAEWQEIRDLLDQFSRLREAQLAAHLDGSLGKGWWSE